MLADDLTKLLGDGDFEALELGFMNTEIALGGEKGTVNTPDGKGCGGVKSASVLEGGIGICEGCGGTKNDLRVD